ncbi:alkaline phosphatase family protein [Flavobacteriaceae bacterium Ap0902]|nr:alkaline phosphatase family protein [Flavobacteriaceae bacterium Ap0902]
MKKILFVALALTSFLNAQVQRPKLVVGIVIDQMRTDYLYRYSNDFGEDGFKKLMREGFVFKNTHYNYMPTYTAPGHASIYTGTTPAIHGIVGNSWFHKSENQYVYVTTDPAMKSVGMAPDAKLGQMSPRRLKATTITDELKLETNHRAKVIGISIKDRGAILPAGHFADAAYWMNANGDFISSSYYFNQLPKWVQNYNGEKNAEKFIAKGWDLLKPMPTYDESTKDDTPYERIFEPKTAPTFPYDLKSIADLTGDNEIIKTTPYGNDMVAEMGKRAILNEGLGQDNFPDFLALSFSSTDYAGHNFGPRSIEIQDMYLRLDLTIADLIKFLDKQVGDGNYILFLTADHAAAENPKYLYDHRYEVKSLNSKETEKVIKDVLEQKYDDQIFVNYSNQNIFLNESYIKENKLKYEQILFDIKTALEEKPFITRVYTREEILQGNPNNYHLSMIARGYDPKQNGDMVIILDPQYMEYYETGTTHGSTYMYDTHVPNIWYGQNIPKGESNKRYIITDIAPTLSQLLNIPIPNGSEGNNLTDLFEE